MLGHAYRAAVGLTTQTYFSTTSAPLHSAAQAGLQQPSTWQKQRAAAQMRKTSRARLRRCPLFVLHQSYIGHHSIVGLKVHSNEPTD